MTCAHCFFCFVFIVLPHRFSLSLIHLFFIWPFCSSKSPFVQGFRPKQFALIDSLPRSRLKDRNQYRFLQVSCPPYSRVSQWVSLTRWELRVTGVASCERQRQVSCLRGPAKWKCVKIKIKKKRIQTIFPLHCSCWASLPLSRVGHAHLKFIHAAFFLEPS